MTHSPTGYWAHIELHAREEDGSGWDVEHIWAPVFKITDDGKMMIVTLSGRVTTVDDEVQLWTDDGLAVESEITPFAPPAGEA